MPVYTVYHEVGKYLINILRSTKLILSYVSLCVSGKQNKKAKRERVSDKERGEEAEHTCKETADGLGTQRRTNCSIFNSLNTNSHLLP